MNCITFHSVAPDTTAERTVVKSLRLRISDGVNKEDGKVTFTLEYSGPLIQTPGMATFLVCAERAQQIQYLVPKGGVSFPDKQHLTSGFLEVRMVTEAAPEDSIILHYQKRGQYSVKDGLMYSSNEYVAKMVHFSRTWMRLEFGPQSKGVDKKRLQDLLRLFGYCGAEDGSVAPKFVDPTAEQKWVSLEEHPSDDMGPDQKLILVRASDGERDPAGSLQVNSIAVTISQSDKAKKGKIKAAVNLLRVGAVVSGAAGAKVSPR